MSMSSAGVPGSCSTTATSPRSGPSWRCPTTSRRAATSTPGANGSSSRPIRWTKPSRPVRSPRCRSTGSARPARSMCRSAAAAGSEPVVVVSASRLTLARKRRGLSLVRLAELTGISTRSLSAYEKGEQRPGPGRVGVIAARLGYPVEFFFAVGIDELPPAAVSFRAPSKLPAVRRDAALGAGRLAMELDRWMVERFELPAPDVPSLDRRDPELAADEVRARWGLGVAPVPNMVHLLEAHGIRVFSLRECAEVDAFSTVWEGTPYVFLNVGTSGERGRFDAAHELGHLVLHGEREAGPAAEREANRFAAAFLMPRADVLAHLPPTPSAETILAAKRRWQVAAMALT